MSMSLSPSSSSPTINSYGAASKHPSFGLEITTTTVTKVVTNAKYEKMD